MSDFKPKVWMRCPLCREQSPMPDPDVREWVALTDEDKRYLNEALNLQGRFPVIDAIEAALRSKNT